MASSDETQDATDQPPSYSLVEPEPEQPALLLPPLDLSRDAGPSSYATVTPDQCAAHLKFLAALADLRDGVASTQGLFGIDDPRPEIFLDNTNEAWARIKEKRWAVYTTRAAARYATWWDMCVPASRSRPTLRDLVDEGYSNITTSTPLAWSQDLLPPLDVLMIWHAHMLNPRAFLEDCIRHGKMSAWTTGFPWEAINASIDDRTLEYDVTQTAKDTFLAKTRLQWDNLLDTNDKMLCCPSCDERIFVPWTSGSMGVLLENLFRGWSGIADKDFIAVCPRCRLTLNHESLKIAKLRQDITALLTTDLPMPGTYYNLHGVPEPAFDPQRRKQQFFFPNRFLGVAGRDILDRTSPRNNQTPLTMKTVNEYIATKLKQRDIMWRANPNSFQTNLYPDEKVSYRRMMSHYWDNFSPFALDLVGAVIRQGTFVEKMDKIDWLHSPTILPTMNRLIKKYQLFFQIMTDHPSHMAVPTLDVDLAWHTHQLTPGRYLTFSLHRTSTSPSNQTPIFIDHDDKVDETKLSDCFEWTSKAYRKLTDGEIYSECTCWYCEAIREPDFSRSLPSLFPSSFSFLPSTTLKARSAATNLHTRADISSDPDKNPHISAHNAVRPDLPSLGSTASKLSPSSLDPRAIKYLKLRHDYEKAQRRAQKQKRRSKSGIPPHADTKSQSQSKDPNQKENQRGAASDSAVLYATPFLWGYPVIVPYYAPFACDPGVHSDAYVANPSSISPAHL
ncbi:hypothetical protein BO70DRAFT_392790 [Aspergillus heteromorphus CBS 117.55]|uniref:Alpha-ketoglutarate-dependent sulfonate dioxygenase n=1 Tax=Aspergillus heteromorphus CBS 117.55 TaxID=1448321 RepID=A0A317X0N5_9EURO|nr:uncharacterized protein BO70DRAFT_392790 [Aspergillus heteromorphus CBS 117.55]PWY91142.1 hypothetical protein BO70DRAFT_392790 [Aspergillus heteromorphus CBS 117.55]